MRKKSQILEGSGFVIIPQEDFIDLCKSLAEAIKSPHTAKEIDVILIPFNKITDDMKILIT